MTTTTVSAHDRIRGALMGLAIGDAVGTTYETLHADAFPPLSPADLAPSFRGGGKFDLLPGEWTDDTSTALLAAASLLDCDGRFDAVDQTRRLVAWYDHGHMSVTGGAFPGNNIFSP